MYIHNGKKKRITCRILQLITLYRYLMCINVRDLPRRKDTVILSKWWGKYLKRHPNIQIIELPKNWHPPFSPVCKVARTTSQMTIHSSNFCLTNERIFGYGMFSVTNPFLSEKSDWILIIELCNANSELKTISNRPCGFKYGFPCFM